MSEPEITINGHRLTEAQSLAVRCAIEGFTHELQANGLGDDDHGRRMTAAYLDRIAEVRAMIFGGT